MLNGEVKGVNSRTVIFLEEQVMIDLLKGLIFDDGFEVGVRVAIAEVFLFDGLHSHSFFLGGHRMGGLLHLVVLVLKLRGHVLFDGGVDL